LALGLVWSIKERKSLPLKSLFKIWNFGVANAKILPYITENENVITARLVSIEIQ
jgi:hypothetical protein